MSTVKFGPDLPADPKILASSAVNLISLPEVYLKLKQVIDSEDSSMEDVAKVVSLDPALVARLLKIANSALYSFPSQVETVSRAVNILGIREIHDLVLATSVAKAFQGLPNGLMDMNTFWFRSVQCGFLAQHLAQGVGNRRSESLFVLGLMHDIGHLVLYTNYPDQCRDAMAESGDDFIRRNELERQLIGCDAYQLGAEIMRSWSLPDAFVQALLHIDNPEGAVDHNRDVAILHIAARLTHGVDTDLLLGELVAMIDSNVWDEAGLVPQVAALALDDSSLEVVDAMYQVLAH
ncbi:MAG: HDOD domain-containing protein [Gammaproteobacteria bacterium]|nr:HDOD domain-containing protein [Gammaproteobacteria bacterium]